MLTCVDEVERYALFFKFSYDGGHFDGFGSCAYDYGDVHFVVPHLSLKSTVSPLVHGELGSRRRRYLFFLRSLCQAMAEEP